MENREFIKLTDWEVANFHLPPVTTVTLYEGEASIEIIRSRLTSILQKNPWLSSRIVKDEGKKAIPRMEYSTDFDIEKTFDQHIKVYTSDETEIESLNPVRKEGFEEAKIKVISNSVNAMFTSIGFGLGIVGTYLGVKMFKKAPQNVCVNEVDPLWANNEKMKAKEEDVVSSSLIHQSISTPTGEFKAKREAIPQSKIPGFWKLLKNRTSILTNWATFYTDVILQDNGENKLQPKLHLPIMETKGMITSVWNAAVVFRPL